MLSFKDFVSRLKEIKEMGWIQTHRAGNTGVGKTLEDLLEIKENNIAGPDHKEFELKSARKNAKSLLTLFTKSPLPKSANALLLQKFGYPSARGNNKKELHTTVSTIKFNRLKGKPGFKIKVFQNKISLISKSGEELGYWDKETLRRRFEEKYPGLIYVKAESREKGKNENFWFNEAYLLQGFNFSNFLKLVKEGVILVDIRIGQYSDGQPHDHGTGFRVKTDKLDLCFKNRKLIV